MVGMGMKTNVFVVSAVEPDHLACEVGDEGDFREVLQGARRLRLAEVRGCEAGEDATELLTSTR